MTTLAELQRRFQEAVLGENPLPDLFAGEEEGLAGGFDLYLQAYRARLAAALRDNFPVLHRALGDDAFATLAGAYIAEHPSRFRSIRWFGDSLTDFIARFPERVGHPALLDLARMDWAMRAAFDAADSAATKLPDLAALHADEWPEHRFHLMPSLQILDLTWAVEPLWKALNDDAEARTEEPQIQEHALLIWRPALDCCWRSAEAGEAAALRALGESENFAHWCAALAKAGEPEPAMAAATLLRRWVEEGLLAKSAVPA